MIIFAFAFFAFFCSLLAIVLYILAQEFRGK